MKDNTELFSLSDALRQGAIMGTGFSMITSKEKAGKTHQSKPMPDSNAELKCNRFYNRRHLEKINLGYEAQVMEEKWNIYREGEWLYLHRSWTGLMIFKAHFTPVENGELLDKIVVNRDKSQYLSTDDEKDKALALLLIDKLAIRPVRKGRPPDPVKIIKEKWICSGCGQENMTTKREFREIKMTVWPPGIKCKKCGKERFVKNK